MTDDIPDRLRTLATEPGESPLVKAFGAWTPLEPETVPARGSLAAWLDRPADAPCSACSATLAECSALWADGRSCCASCVLDSSAPDPHRQSWRMFERDCTCNPGPVPVEGGFVWRRCSCETQDPENRSENVR